MRKPSRANRRHAASAGQRCKTCQHPKRAQIDKLLVKGKAVARVAKAYGLPETSVRRHVKHIRAVVTKAKRQRERRREAAILSVEQQYARDGRDLDKRIKEAKSPDERQKWYLVKFRWYDLGLKYGFLKEWLHSGGQNGKRNGAGKQIEDLPLPDAVQRVIDAVVSDE